MQAEEIIIKTLREAIDKEQERAVKLEDEHGLAHETTAEAHGIVEGIEQALKLIQEAPKPDYVKVTIFDPDSGETEELNLDEEGWILFTAKGKYHLYHRQVYPKTGTINFTLKRGDREGQ